MLRSIHEQVNAIGCIIHGEDTTGTVNTPHEAEIENGSEPMSCESDSDEEKMEDAIPLHEPIAWKPFNINPVILGDLVRFLAIFTDAIAEWESDKRPTVHKVLLWKMELLRHCDVESDDSYYHGPEGTVAITNRE